MRQMKIITPQTLQAVTEEFISYTDCWYDDARKIDGFNEKYFDVINPVITQGDHNPIKAEMFAALFDDDDDFKPTKTITVEDYRDWARKNLKAENASKRAGTDATITLDCPFDEVDWEDMTLGVYKCSCGNKFVDFEEPPEETGCFECGLSHGLNGYGFQSIKEVRQAIKDGEADLEGYILDTYQFEW